MRIVLFIHSLNGGGAERIASLMARYWSQKGHSVTVLTIASIDDNRYVLPEKVALRALCIDGDSKNLLAAVYNNISRLKILRRTFREIQPDIVISMMAQANVMAGLACIGLTIKSIGAERHYPGMDYTGRLWGILRKFTYCFLDVVVTQTYTSEKWISDFTNSNRVLTIPNPLELPLAKLDPVVEPKKPDGTKLLLGVGRLNKQKQFSHLIECFACLAEKYSDWNLVIVGEGVEEESLTQMISKYSLAERARLIGRVGNIGDWYRAADVFALTSESEGFPNALIEAMAHGVPCISYDCLTGPGEIIENGINGLLIDSNNREDLVAGLEKLFCSADLRCAISRNSLDIIEKSDPDAIMAVWEKEMLRLIGGKKEN